MSREAWRRAALRPVDSASVAVFRIGLGGVGLLLVWRFFARGWIDSLFIEPGFHFPYPGFEWVRVWPGWGMHAHFALMGVAALGVLLGYRVRFSAALFALLLAYVELVDRSLYLNHYYWAVLAAALLVFLPVDRAYAIIGKGNGADRSSMIPMWVIWLLRFQVGMVYFFSGLAKVNTDWLLRGEPLATWLPARADLPLLGALLTIPAAAIVMAWLGAFFDLTIIAWLSWRRTRALAFGVLVAFHTLTWLLFPAIGVFPLLMTLAATVFFDPAWPRRLTGPLQRGAPDARFRWRAHGVVPIALYTLLMIALPLRHHLVPGDVKWTGEGYLASWQVMLSEKSGSAMFVVTDPDTGNTWSVPPPAVLTPRQQAVMATDPVMIQQTASLIAADHGGAAVAADVVMTFNGRPSVQFTDPTVDLTDLAATVPVRRWLMPEPG